MNSIPRTTDIAKSSAGQADSATGREERLLTPEAHAPNPMEEQRLAEIVARAEAATAGPWQWSGNTDVRDMRLQAQHHGGLTVMDFVRWGMQDACPRFARNWAMYRADEMAEYQVHQMGWVDKSEPPYRADISGIDHPDARFIAAAREDVPALLAEVTRLREERHSTNEALSDAAETIRVQRDRIAELEAAAAQVAKFCAARAEYVDNINNCSPSNDRDYWRWNGHAESRRQLSQLLGLPVGWPAEDGEQ
ncbi:hypothetical protein [Streptomyces sp. NPDC001919]